jgi:hypothetical protein
MTIEEIEQILKLQESTLNRMSAELASLEIKINTMSSYRDEDIEAIVSKTVKSIRKKWEKELEDVKARLTSTYELPS